ncbi:hypothetical protein CVT25_007940 [Psilocybe cyanescens]|uniref:Uncharacterized protein n=1 Tax=Psilocybe cyanescens TaxID=93625 RepID=A0A409XQT7_PSICY|nr:hypothetical protein CVT25_007940 [Psilocybe cyanescens]
MHLLRRAKSIANKNSSKQHPDSAPSSASSSRLPLVPQTNIGVQSTPSSPSLPSDHASSSNISSVHGSSPTKRVIGSKISHRDVVDDRSKTVHSIPPSSTETQAYQGLTPPPPRSSRETKPAYSELYTQNDLSTFSFGAAPSNASSSSSQPPVDPLTRLPEDDEISISPSILQDTTPRPSVVGSQHPLTYKSHYPTQNDWESSARTRPPSRGARAAGKAKAQDSDTASSHTFGTSSASASVSSLSRPRGDNSRAASRTSDYSSTTPQTSANDTSDDDDDMIGRHPIPPEPRPPGPPIRYTSTDRDSSIYLSEEDFDGEEYEPDIEIESAVPDISDRGTIDYTNASRESFMPIQSERRGSAAMAIPKKQSDNSYHDSFPDNRPWDYDFSKDRRGSKSMIERSFMQSGESSSHERPLPPAPTSVPESEGDWQNLRKRSMTAQRDKDLPLITPSDSPLTATSSTPFSSINGSTAVEASVPDSLNWIQEFSLNGVVTFDSSEMQDIVGDTDLSSRFFRKASTNSAARRTSTVSSTDIMHKNITTSWANAKDRELNSKWSSRKVKENPDEQPSRRHNGNERERPSIANLFPRASTSTFPDFHTSGSSAMLDKSDSKHKDRDKDKTAATKPKWNGMAPDSEEIWSNFHLGNHKVQRKNAPSAEQGKPAQQRLHAQHIRSPAGLSGTGRDQADGPTVTIHKHSKAAAFSLSRNHRRSSSSTTGQATTSSSRHAGSSNGQVSSKDSVGNSRKKSNMILLATRRVQKAYTSTNTTRKLDTHGLLDDSGRTSPRPMESARKENERDHDRHQSSRSKDKESRSKDKESRSKDKELRSKDKESRTKDKERKGKEREKDKSRTGGASSSRRSGAKSEAKSREVVAADMPLPDSSESSAGSVSFAVSSGDSGTMIDSSAGTTPDQSEVVNSIGSTGSIEHSIRSQATASSDRTISRTVHSKSHSKSKRRDQYDSNDGVDEDGEDDSSDGIPGISRYPTRTPHRETYAALPPEVFENAHQEHSSTGIFGWGRSKGSDRNGPRANQYLDASYKPPWPVTQPRTNSEARKGIVDDLNTSFQDVGLLPATGEIKGSSNHGGQHRRKRDQHPKKPSKRDADTKNPTPTDIFETVPDEALYMLLPLWPGETDSYSARKYPYDPPSIPTHSRQYLLIYYKTFAKAPPTAEETSKSRSGEKKRSQEAAGEAANDKSVLLHTFHITARVFSYRDLQGSGVRIPDVGLAICGSLEEAYESIPVCQRKDDYVIGVCHSREAGIEFVPEGFDKIGLSKLVPNPRASEPPEEDEDSSSFDTMPILTPIGRAVMEMAWLGALAVTSFNPNH